MPPEEVPKARVLVVDRHEADRLLFSKVLSRAGFEVIEAARGVEAVTALSLYPCELVLLEIGIEAEELDGIAAVRALSPVPIIAVAPDISARRRALSAGCALCLVKPVDIRRLPSRVRALLCGGGSSR
ncbi:MAG: response regulator [Deltaproteobacteria bacterium]|nr:response regulator [Deltaproteobacteria bacterium]